LEAEATHEELASRQTNRRKAPRFDVEGEATLFLVNHGSQIPCHVVDLSLGGCRVRTRERFRAGSLVRVEISFKVRGLAFRLGGVTLWTDGRHLVGIRFVDMIARRKEALAEALGEIENEIAEKIKKQAAEANDRGEDEKTASLPAVIPVIAAPSQPVPVLPPLPTIQAPETERLKTAGPGVSLPPEESVPALTDHSLRPFVVHRPPTKPAETRAADPVQRNRREQSRQEVDTSAVIHLVNIAARLKGRILDLSLSGCRIRTDERFPVGIYTRVETEFHLEGLPFRLGGVIQALHDRHHVGIRFLDMSPRKLEQLQYLIAEIEETRKSRE
jgi:c-di-GMP-binding flagellar brake protein YcgR